MGEAGTTVVVPDFPTLLRDGLFAYPKKDGESFGWYQLCESTFRHIHQILPAGKTILELGSGWVSGQLAKDYKVFSVEENPQWLNRSPCVDYIWVPIDSVSGWYNVPLLAERLPKEYDFLIVDGPAGAFETGRRGFFDNLSLFKTDIPILFDDLHFFTVYRTFMEIALKLNRVPYLYPGDVTKSYGVLY